MPSPLAHGGMVFLVRAFTRRYARLRDAIAGRPLFFFGAVLFTLWVPDGDFVLHALFDRPVFAHGAAMHSLFAGVWFALGFAVACRLRYGTALPFNPTFGIGVACAWSHALMDMATWGSGVMLLWPFSDERIAVIPLFVGVHRSEPLMSSLHVATVATELLFCAAVWAIARLCGRSRSVASRVHPARST